MKTRVLMSCLLLGTGCATTGIGVGELELHGLPTARRLIEGALLQPR